MAKSSPYALLPTSLAMYTQSDVKDERDLSKNLVGGDFESRASDKSVSRKGRRCGVVLLVAALTVSYIWLIGLTVVREVQLAALRDNVGQLSANLVALEARINANRLFEEFKNLEDTVSRLVNPPR